MLGTTWPASLTAGLVGLILLCCGCSAPEEIPVFPAQGKLLVGGKPVKGILVFLRPLQAAAGVEAFMPSGIVKEDGSFCLTTRKPGDGAPSGEYIVTLASAPGIRGVGDVDARYKNPKTSPLRATINPVPYGQANDLPPIEIP